MLTPNTFSSNDGHYNDTGDTHNHFADDDIDDDEHDDDDDALQGFAVKRLEAVPSECKQIALSLRVCTDALHPIALDWTVLHFVALNYCTELHSAVLLCTVSLSLRGSSLHCTGDS